MADEDNTDLDAVEYRLLLGKRLVQVAAHDVQLRGEAPDLVAGGGLGHPAVQVAASDVGDLRADRFHGAQRAIDDEGKRVLAALPKNAHVVALEVTGKPYSSEQLARRLEHWRTLGRDIALLIGGPEGHAPDVVAAAHEKWSLSPLTLPHMLVRLVVAEQVYRAAAMLANHPYHRA